MHLELRFFFNEKQPLLTAHADIILRPHVNTEFEMCQIDGVLIVSVKNATAVYCQKFLRQLVNY